MDPQDAVSIAKVHGWPTVKFASNRIREARIRFFKEFQNPDIPRVTMTMNKLRYSIGLTVDDKEGELSDVLGVALQYAIDKFPLPIWIDSEYKITRSGDYQVCHIFAGDEDMVVQTITEAHDKLLAHVWKRASYSTEPSTLWEEPQE